MLRVKVLFRILFLLFSFLTFPFQFFILSFSLILNQGENDMPRAKSRKHPCRICRKWFLQDPRLSGRQKTCGSPECKQEWHKKKCAQWNRKNVISFRENYLQQKLNSATDSTPEAFMPDIPVRFIIDWIGLKQFIIIDYLAGYVLRRAQSVRLSIPAKPP